MKIIKPGRKDRTIAVYYGRCPSCDCEFECGLGETRERRPHFWGEVYRAICCPSCGTLTKVFGRLARVIPPQGGSGTAKPRQRLLAGMGRDHPAPG